MKKTLIIAAAIAATLIAVLASTANKNDDIVRIHIRANSNVQLDQNLKYIVKDDVCDFLRPILAKAKTKAEAMTVLSQNLNGIKNACDASLRKLGAAYTSKIYLRQEEFPARDYAGKTYEAGIYDALIVELGEGVGNNWWCVIYPQLCFTSVGKEGFEYNSKIKELLNKIGGNQ